VNIWVLAVYLQILDILTTFIGVCLGGSEVAPIARLIISHLGLFAGLAMLKLLAGGFLILLWRIKRTSVVIKTNYVFMIIIIWNLVMILRALPQFLRS
jgi:hypothetical protein